MNTAHENAYNTSKLNVNENVAEKLNFLMWVRVPQVMPEKKMDILDNNTNANENILTRTW